jgi:hypothetical protein
MKPTSTSALIKKSIIAISISTLILLILLQWTNLNLQEISTYPFSLQALTQIIISSFIVWLFRSIRVYLLYQPSIPQPSIPQPSIPQPSIPQLKSSSAFYSLAMQAVAIQNALIRITPFRLGEFALPFILKKFAQIDMSKGIYQLILLRLSEMCLLGGFLMYALFKIYASLVWQNQSITLGLIYTPLIIALVALLILMLKMKSILQWIISKLIPLHIRLKPLEKIKNHLDELKDLAMKDWLILLLCTFMILCGQFILFDGILKLCQIDLPLEKVLIGGTIAHFSNLLPVPTIGNIGTHEIGWVSAFVFLGVSQNQAMISALIGQILTLILALAWGALGLIALWRNHYIAKSRHQSMLSINADKS